VENKKLICIRCPIGCPLTIEFENNKISCVSGNSCPRGESYARKELTDPTRIVTSTVKVEGGISAMVPVKTKDDIPKDKILECMKALKDITVKAPVFIGDVIIENVAETKVSIVASKNIAVSGH